MTERSVLFNADGIEATEAIPDDGPALQSLFEDCADFFELTTGLPPGPAEAQSLFIALPEGKTYDDKRVISLFTEAGRLVGVMDVIRDHPKPDAWWLGLVLLHPAYRRRGVGTRIVRSFMSWVTAAGAKEVYLAVKEQNEMAYRFWSRMGFTVVEVRPPKGLGAKESATTVMKRETGPAQGAHTQR
jgi:GNAT superfamily N-acetyltransferase